ncbi:hypothetical protein GOODEAATRI_033784 [Goodea atripinnis]|uniref:Uncharacterized protein n=1 Tax=Goodea atripinnis TaxID=208336 RepID=A0ABV0NFU8_9TELE
MGTSQLPVSCYFLTRWLPFLRAESLLSAFLNGAHIPPHIYLRISWWINLTISPPGGLLRATIPHRACSRNYRTKGWFTNPSNVMWRIWSSVSHPYVDSLNAFGALNTIKVVVSPPQEVMICIRFR